MKWNCHNQRKCPRALLGSVLMTRADEVRGGPFLISALRGHSRTQKTAMSVVGLSVAVLLLLGSSVAVDQTLWTCDHVTQVHNFTMDQASTQKGCCN